MSEPSRPPTPPPDAYDVLVVGGALSGASTALLLRRWCPEARILVVERQTRFTRKVGEATVELSGMFLTRMLGFYDELARHHLPKHGLRFWFSNHEGQALDELTEVGARNVSSHPSFQIDRARFDEHVLATVGECGVEVLRPAKVKRVELGWPQNRVTVEHQGRERQIGARWVIDASGRQTFLARRLGLVETVEEHPTAAAWGRWSGVLDLDGPEVQGTDSRVPRLEAVRASRRLATNHFCGYGYWCWVIPLGNGDTSIGVVYDKRHFDWPTPGPVKERYRHFVTEAVPGLKELVADATLDEDDFLAYKDLPYRVRQYMDRGWAIVGDAASFLDPFYSPGLDHMSISVYATATIIGADLQGGSEEQLRADLERHNSEFDRSYDNWLRALYLDKYELLGDAELTTASFFWDTGMYYMAVINPVWDDLENLRNPMLGTPDPGARFASVIMHRFRHRMVQLARFRRRVGLYGRRNSGRRLLLTRFDVERPKAFRLVLRGVRIWLRAELQYLWHRVRHGRPDLSAPVAAPMGEPQAAEAPSS